MQDRGMNIVSQARYQLIDRAHNLKLPLRLSLQPEKACRQCHRHPLGIRQFKRRRQRKLVALACDYHISPTQPDRLRPRWITRNKDSKKASGQSPFASAWQIDMPLIASHKEITSLPTLRKV